jgi:hypothetical protein
MVATPMYDGMCTQGFFQSMRALTIHAGNHGLVLQHYAMGNESLIQRARNYCTDHFMRSGFSHLLFIDADIEFSPTAVTDMLALADPQGPYDILCAPYPKKTIAFEKALLAMQRGLIKNVEDFQAYLGDFVLNVHGTININLSQPFEINEGGTGFMMIQRHAFERVADRFPDLYYAPDHKRDKPFDGSRTIPAFFDCEIDRGTFAADVWSTLRDVAAGKTGAIEHAQKIIDRSKTASMRYLSEDYQFCRMAREAGLKVWFCPWIETAHHGRYAYNGNFARTLMADISPTFDDQPQATLPGGNHGKQPQVLVPFT